MKNIIILFSLVSCLEIDCNKLKKEHLRQECLIVVEQPPKESVWFEVNGYHPKTGKKCNCESSNRWWSLYSSQIEKGDTIIKRKGELSFNIHKKNKILTYYWKCNGKEYR